MFDIAVSGNAQAEEPRRKSVREWGRKGSGVDKVLVKRLKHLLKKIEREQSDFFCFPLGVGGKNKH